MAPEPYIPDEQERWRNEVASRVSSYKARRHRSDGDYSMKLDFEAPQPAPEPSPLASAVAEQKSSREVCDTHYYRRVNAEAMAQGAALALAALENYDPDFDFTLQKLPEVVESPETEVIEQNLASLLERNLASPPESEGTEVDLPVVIPQTTNNVLLFPRPTVEPPLAPPPTSRDELADRVFDRPRILDVPEDNVPTIQGPLFADIHLDAEVEDEMRPSARMRPEFEIPLQVAPLMQRAFAGACDWGIVLIASTVFFVLSWKSMGNLPDSKAGIAALALIPVALWTVYQFLFHLYAGETPGMRLAHLRLCDFQREVPEWELRKKRALYSTFSCLSVGVGYLWALVDEDTLCWHDRASRTYLTQE
jgi:uncharacterized RDD family membrane protein YckC